MSKIFAIIVWLVAMLFVMYDLFIENGFWSISFSFVTQGIQLSQSDFGTLAAVSFIVYAVLQIPAGILVSRYSTKIILTLASSFVALGMLIYSQADSFATLAAARAVTAIGSAFAFVSVATLIGRWFESDKFPIVFGFTQTLGNLSVVGANMFLPQIIEGLVGWRHTGYLLCIIGAVIAGLCFVIVKTAPTIADSKCNACEQTLSLTESFKILLTNKQVWITIVFASFLLGSFFNFGANWQISFQQTFGNSLSASAHIDSVMFLGFAIGSPILGVLSAKLHSRRKILILSSFLSLIVIAILFFSPKFSDEIAMVLYFCFGFLCGGGILAYTVIMESLPASVQSIGVGLCNMVVYLTGALLSLIIGNILSAGVELTANNLAVDRIGLSLFFFAIAQSFTVSLFIKESYKS